MNQGQAPVPPQNEERPSRLSSAEIYPLHRSSKIEGASAYWIGGFPFPMPFRVRQWMQQFLSLLKAELEQQGLRQENFLRFRVAAGEQTERFLQTSAEYQPLAGYAMPPDGKPVKPPTAEDIEKSIKNGGFKLTDWVGDYTYWFLKKQDERQRQDFFGVGGMLFLWMKPDPNTVPPPMDIPPPAQAYLDEQGKDMKKILQELYALQDGFMEKSREVFGGGVANDASFEGVPFVLPILEARHMMQASPEELARWFTVFDGYMVESLEDQGVLLLFREPEFDETILKVLEQMKSGGFEWPLGSSS